MPRSSTLPAGLPGHAVSVVDELARAVDGDDGTLYIQRRDRKTWQPVIAPQHWKFRPALWTQHGWWCAEGDHLRCLQCLQADLAFGGAA